jgi:hypothetical protein
MVNTKDLEGDDCDIFKGNVPDSEQLNENVWEYLSLWLSIKIKSEVEGHVHEACCSSWSAVS